MAANPVHMADRNQAEPVDKPSTPPAGMLRHSCVYHPPVFRKNAFHNQKHKQQLEAPMINQAVTDEPVIVVVVTSAIVVAVNTVSCML